MGESVKAVNTVYENKSQLEKFFNSLSLDQGKNCLVRIHSAFIDKNESVKIAKEVKACLPYSEIIGCATSGNIVSGEILEKSVLISVIQFEYGQFKTQMFSLVRESDEQLIDEFVEYAQDYDAGLAFIFFGNLESKVTQIIQNVNERLPDVAFVGGVAGYLSEDGIPVSYVFTDQEAMDAGYVCALIKRDFVLAYTNTVNGHPTISDIHTITKTENSFILEIDNEDAVSWINKQLGIQKLSENSDWESNVSTDILLRFPIVLEDGNGATRFLQYDGANNRLALYFSELPSGTKFRIGYLSSLDSVEKWQEVHQELQTISSEVVTGYSCLFRKLFADNISKWEINAFKGTNFSGAYLLGEVGTNNGCSNVLNGSLSFVTLAEKENYINFNLDAFSSIDGLIGENDELITQIKQVQETLDEGSGANVLRSLMEVETRMKNRTSYGITLDLKSTAQFLLEQSKDNEKYICFIQIENNQQLIEKHGRQAFDELFQFNVKSFREAMKKEFPRLNFKLYMYDDTSIYFTIEQNLSPDRFIRIAQTIFNDSEHFDYEVDYKNRFIITVKGMKIHKLKEHANYLTQMNQPLFYVEEVKESINQEINEDFKMVKTIQSAIENNEVLPYFQGIHDNRNNTFYCYEALMRIRDEDGKILFPGDFMEVSKKYNLYLNLSESMVMKVLELFGDREEIITLNISYYDVISEDFNKKLFEKLESMKRPGHFIFEIVETERVDKPEVLRDFIRRIKQYGIKVAIDDFGSGYSNFIEIGNLNIDYIKINGSLTQLLGTDISYDQILESISYMGKKMEVKLIAEFVETASMQKRLVECGVHYSQGYLFSKPMSLDEMYIVSEENIKKQKQNFEKKHNLKEFPFNSTQIKNNNLLMIWGGIIISLIAIIGIFAYANLNEKSVGNMSDTYLVEIATGMVDKVSAVVVDASSTIQMSSVAISQVYTNPEEMNQTLTKLHNLSLFSDIYVSLNGEYAVNGEGSTLPIDVDQYYGKSNQNEVIVHSPLVENSTNRSVLLISTNLYDENGDKIGEIIGKNYLDEFNNVLNLRSFGSEAYFHLCEIDGTALLLSGSSDNLYKDGDMYSFIGTLDIRNGHTVESIRKDMEEGNTVLLNYYINNEKRSAVMSRVPGTNWCIVSIMLSEVNDEMIEAITNNTLIFAIGLATLFTIYFIINVRLASQNRRDLIKALESSYFLTSSLQKSMETDTLTRAYSRATAVEKITDAIHEAELTDKVQALVLLDVDNFKEINDTYGHQTGDIYLQDFVRAVRSVLRSDDILGRTGGDEFILLLQNCESKEEVEEIVRSIVEQVGKISIRNFNLDKIGVSIGVALIPEHGNDYEKLNHKADKALYKSKNEGKNAFNIYQDI